MSFINAHILVMYKSTKQDNSLRLMILNIFLTNLRAKASSSVDASFSMGNVGKNVRSIKNT